MLCRRYPPVIGQRADIPKGGDPLRRAGKVAHLEIIDQVLERALVDCWQRPRQTLNRRNLLKAELQRFQAREIELLGPPLQDLDRLEHVALKPLHQIIGQGVNLPGDAKRAVAQMAAGTARDLAELRGRKLPVGKTVELPVLGKGDMVDIEIEPHADGVGGHQVIDVTVLVELHLRVAGARAQRPQHDRRPAALTPHQFGDRVNLVGRKRHDRRAPRQPRDLLRACVVQLRQARTLDDGHPRQQLLENAAHRCRSEQQRFLRPRNDRIRSVKTWPRSRSPAICTSSMATKAASVCCGIASTVQTE
jgi:hypothetical protein